MASFLVEIEYTTYLVVRVESDRDVPSQEEIDDAKSFTNNHLEDTILDETIISIEKE